MTPLELAARFGTILDDLDIAWVLGGSLASSIVGEPRSTLDIDVAVLLERHHVAPLVESVGAEFYVSEEMALEAVEHGSSFNLVHLDSGMKIDLFVLTGDALDLRQLQRRQLVEIEPGTMLWVGAPDDQVLRKLRWYQAGGEISDRQWRDVLAILTVQGDRIDRAELVRAARDLGLEELATRAVQDVTAG